jgi:hypothetical protein
MAETPEHNHSSRTIARYTRAQFWLALIVALVGFGGAGFLGGRSTAPTETVTERIRVAPEGETPKTPDGDGVSGARACVEPERRGDDREPNNLSGQASGPVLAGRRVPGEISTSNDSDFFALCVNDEAELHFSLECIEAPDDDCSAFADFGLDQPDASYFESGQPSACTVRRPGRYYIEVEANAYPVRYRFTVEADPTDALVTALKGPLAVTAEPCA